MAEQNQVVDVEQTGTLDSMESFLNDLIAFEQRTVKDQNRDDLLSKVLFPNTHNATVMLHLPGNESPTEYKLRPVPVKWAKKIRDVLSALQVKWQAGYENKDVVVDMTEDNQSALTEVAKVLADFYGWTPVKAALDDAGLTTSELQTIAVEQLYLQGTNDFLLNGLRKLVKVMQVEELMSVKLGQRASTSTTQS